MWLILVTAALASLYPVFSILSFNSHVSEGQAGESLPNSLNRKGGVAAWGTVSLRGFRGSYWGTTRVVPCFCLFMPLFLITVERTWPQSNIHYSNYVY